MPFTQPRRKPLVYIAGPYRAPNPVHNTRNAVQIAQTFRDKLDIVVCIPHLSMLEDQMHPKPENYWLRTTLDQMRVCDAVFRIAGESVGSDAEVAEAVRLGIPVLRNAFELAQWVSAWRNANA